MLTLCSRLHTGEYHLLIGRLPIASDIVTGERIKWVFDCMPPFKSPGEDGIFPALMQKGTMYLLNPIKCIYRAS